MHICICGLFHYSILVLGRLRWTLLLRKPVEGRLNIISKVKSARNLTTASEPNIFESLKSTLIHQKFDQKHEKFWNMTKFCRQRWNHERQWISFPQWACSKSNLIDARSLSNTYFRQMSSDSAKLVIFLTKSYQCVSQAHFHLWA